MAEDLPLEDPIDPIEPIETPDLDEETAKALKHFGIDPDNLYDVSIDDLARIAMRWYKLEEKKIQEKRNKTETPKSELPSDIMTKADYALEKFTDKNPELTDYTDELKAYQKKGLSLDEAKTLILNSDKALVNREKVNSLGLSDWETSNKKSSYSMKDLEKLASSNPTEYSRVRGEMDAGKIRLDR